MSHTVKLLPILMAMLALTACVPPHHRDNNAIDDQGRPVAPSHQSVVGGPVGKGPAGQPQN